MSPSSQIAERYRNILVSPPCPVPGVCVTCRRNTNGSSRCLQCTRHYEEAGGELADVVVPISLALKEGQLAYALGSYKYSHVDAVRRQFTNELACVLATFLSRHGECVGEFDLVTIVPGTRNRAGEHPLAEILGRRLMITRGRFAEVLSTTGPNTRELRPGCFVVHGDVAGKNILLVDDTWTSGASLQSAAVALKRAGAPRVVGLVIGRRFDPEHRSASLYLESVMSRTYSWETCCLCQPS